MKKYSSPECEYIIFDTDEILTLSAADTQKNFTNFADSGFDEEEVQ